MSSHPFAPKDRVVAVNTQEGPLKLLRPIDCRKFRLPDGPLRQGVVYHVKSVHTLKDGSHGVFITGLSCLWGSRLPMVRQPLPQVGGVWASGL